MPRMKRNEIYLKDVTTRDYQVKITGTADLLLKTRINVPRVDSDNPYAIAANALYWLSEKPEITDKDSFDAAMAAHPALGYPIYAVKKTTLGKIGAGTKAANMRSISAKTALNASFNLIANTGADQGTGPLTVLEYNSVEPFKDPDSNRTLARVSGWSMTVTLRHLEQSKLTVGKIIDALNRGGKAGIGLYAPCGYLSSPGKFGTFKAELLG